jgi:succinate dehydrogenase / fumarate reductase flavoprotein subunit
MMEILDGKGNNVMLKLDHLDANVLHKNLPGICDLAIAFAHVGPVKEPIPVVPRTCHYMMGGRVPTNVNGWQALNSDAQGIHQVIPGLFDVGDVACMSLHGAN